MRTSKSFITGLGLLLVGFATVSSDADQHKMVPPHYFLPDATASAIVSVSSNIPPTTSITVVTQAVAIKETGPAVTVKAFGEVYTFSPSFIMVRKEIPTRLEFWNLQPDDVHQFFLVGPKSESLLFVELPSLKKTSYVLTFHREGLYSFECPMHGAAMSGQIFVIPSQDKNADGSFWNKLWNLLKGK